MTKHIFGTSFLVAGLMATTLSFAQTTPSSEGADKMIKGQPDQGYSDKSRASVKAEASATANSVPKPKRGENRDVAVKASATGEAKTRAEVKKQIKGNRVKTNTGNMKVESIAPTDGAAKTRAEVKLDTTQAK